MSNEQPNYLDVSEVPRDELEQWYMDMSYLVGFLVFQNGTMLPDGNIELRIREKDRSLFYTFGKHARLFFIEDPATKDRVIELRKWDS